MKADRNILNTQVIPYLRELVGEDVEMYQSTHQFVEELITMVEKDDIPDWSEIVGKYATCVLRDNVEHVSTALESLQVIDVNEYLINLMAMTSDLSFNTVTEDVKNIAQEYARAIRNVTQVTDIPRNLLISTIIRELLEHEMNEG
mgnify:CR=1 FL=1